MPFECKKNNKAIQDQLWFQEYDKFSMYYLSYRNGIFIIKGVVLYIINKVYTVSNTP